MLKRYYAEENETGSESEKKDSKVTTSAEVVLEEETPSTVKKSLLELGTYEQKESVRL